MCRYTPPKINIEPENEGLEENFLLFEGGPYSQVPAVHPPGCIPLLTGSTKQLVKMMGRCFINNRGTSGVGKGAASEPRHTSFDEIIVNSSRETRRPERGAVEKTDQEVE